MPMFYILAIVLLIIFLSAAIKILRGGDPRNMNFDAPAPRVVDLEPPRGVLSKVGRAFWKRHAPALVELGSGWFHWSVSGLACRG